VAVIALSMTFFVVYFFGISYFTSNLDQLIEYVEGNTDKVAENLSVLGFIGEAVLLRPIPLIVFILISVGISYLAYAVISAKYHEIINKGEAKLKVTYKEKRLTASGAFSALVKKEFSRFFSSATYVLNGGLGYVFILFIAGFMLFSGGMPLNLDMDPEMMEELGEIPPELMNITKEFFIPLIIAAMVFCYSMNMMTVPTVSLEGKELWIIKSMPVSAESVLLSKLAPSVILNGAVSVVSGILCSIASGADILGVIFYITVPLVASIAFSMLGIVFGTLFPKLDFTNEAEVIKQSFSTFAVMIIDLLLSAGVGILLFIGAVLGIGDLACLITLGAFLMIDTALYFVIKYPISKKFDSLSA